MVLIESNSSAILIELMKNRSAGEMIQAYQALIDRLNASGLFPTEHILNNECSDQFKKQIKLNNMTYQLIPPHDHRRHRVDKAIQTFKDHFISILCGLDASFPLHLWDRLLVQAEHTLNMVHPAWMLKAVLAYTYLYEQHDYNSHPFAPLRCKVEAHVVPEIWETWAPHTTSGYYIGNAMEHYCCHNVYISNTKSMRVCSSVFFKQRYLTMPTLTPSDTLLKAADTLADAITGVLPVAMVTDDAITHYSRSSTSKPIATKTQLKLKGCAHWLHKLKGCSRSNQSRVPIWILLITPWWTLLMTYQEANRNFPHLK
jgi:hypothetical protein